MNEKPTDLMLELQELQEENNDLKKALEEIETEKKMLTSEIRNFQTEIKLLKAEKKGEQALHDKIEFLEGERRNLEEKLEQKDYKFEELMEDKENLIKEKFELMEWKNQTLENKTQKDLELRQKDQDISDLKAKIKKTSTDLLNKTMQIDKLVKGSQNIKDLEEKIKELEEELDHYKNIENSLEIAKQKLKEYEKVEELGDEVLSKETLILTNMEEIVRYLKRTLPLAKSMVRLILPEIHDIEKFELMDILKELPDNIRINIAALVDNPFNDDFVRELKNICQLTNYSSRKFIALNIDSSKFLIGMFRPNDQIEGIYTEFSEFIDILKPTIMEPFLRGKKVF
jgi:chromosome segregation ATPase